MRLRPCPTLSLAIVVLLLAAQGCAHKAPTSLVFPPAEDLRPEPKPRLDPAALESEAALDAHEIAIEGWGERRDRAVGRICRWAVTNGAILPFECPPAEPGGD